MVFNVWYKTLQRIFIKMQTILIWRSKTVELHKDFILSKPLAECNGTVSNKIDTPSFFKRVTEKLKFYFYLPKNAIKTGPNDILLYLNHFPYEKHNTLKYFKKYTNGTIIYMIHDLIPLRYPQFCETQSYKKFSVWINSTFDYADGYICVSKTTQKRSSIIYA